MNLWERAGRAQQQVASTRSGAALRSCLAPSCRTEGRAELHYAGLSAMSIGLGSGWSSGELSTGFETIRSQVKGSIPGIGVNAGGKQLSG
jgi:hypothetical protein